MKKSIILILLTVLMVACMGSLSACGEEVASDPIKVVMEVKDYGTITMELYPEYAPKTVEAVVNYIKAGFYDGLTFHRVIEDFMIQGGDPTGTGNGDPSLKTIQGEFWQNGHANPLSFERGVIGMARSNDYNSATSQFFICQKDCKHLNGTYAAFGRVIEGMEVVDAIATCEKTLETDASGNRYVPKETIYIERMYLVEESK